MRGRNATAIVALSSVATMVGGSGRSKLIALAGGPESIGQYALFLAVMGSLGSLLAGSFPTVAVARIAAKDEESRTLEIAHFSRLATVVALGASLVAGIVILVPPMGSAAYGVGSVVSLSLGTGLTILGMGRVAMLNGVGSLGKMSAALSFGAVAGTLATLAAWPWGAQATTNVAVVAPPACTALAAVVATRRSLRRTPRVRGADHGYSKAFVRVALPASVAASLSPLAVMGVRVLISQRETIASVGIFQAAWSLGAMYTTVALGALGAHYLPRLSALEAQDRVPEAIRQLGFTLSLILAAGILLQLLCSILIRVLFTAEFDAATDLLIMQIPGDVAKTAGWVFAYVLLAQGRTGRYLMLEAVWAGSYLVLSVPLEMRFGLSGLPAAYVASYVVYAVLALALVRLPRAVALRSTELRLAVVGFVVLILSGASIVHHMTGLLVVTIAAAAAVSFQLYRTSERGVS